MVKTWAYIFVVSCLFPYVEIYNFGTDLQPTALVSGFILVVLSYLSRGGLSLSRVEWLFVLVTFFTFILMLLELPDPLAIRGFVTYLSFTIVVIASKLSLGYIDNISKIAYASSAIYIICGILQIVVDPDLFVGIVPIERSAYGLGGRGVESLTPEPTFLAFHLILLSLVRYQYGRKTYLEVIAVVFLSRSASGAATLMPLLFSARHRRVALALSALIAVGLLASALTLVLQGGGRVERIAALVANSDMESLLKDQSINDRLGSVVLSVTSVFFDAGVPHGFVSWRNYVEHNDWYYSTFTYISGFHGRIHSGIGAVLFECGVVGLVFLVAIFAQIRQLGFITLSVALLLLLQSTPLAQPVFAFIVAMGIFAKERRSSVALSSAAAKAWSSRRRRSERPWFSPPGKDAGHQVS
ncbi:hypothetical protein [Mesorhizobium sp.]|uniref:hypothetical protein n=1 Tax=Mesorhizobium sp. TaxID=1871066 RepID=UPI0011FAB8D8|nr:hypothetical protein [Mesorhizobium sp.]TIQ31879.1 MAG: hypothetical protein E5X54_04565 [Mesorhizobium sp.]